MNFLRVAAAVARKDLRVELRSREMLPALAQFAILALLVGNFAFDVDASNSARIAPGILWMVLVFAGLVAFGRTFATERDLGSLEPLLLTPASRTAIFAGKAGAAALLLMACEAVLLPGLGLLYNTPIASPALIATLVLATVGMAGIGCLFAALAAQTRARDLLLPILVIPIWIPLVVAGGRAAQLAMGAGGGGSPNQALALLLDFDILFVVAASLSARFVLDD